MTEPVSARSTDYRIPAVFGENTENGDAVFGHGSGHGRGVVGVSDTGTGTEGNSTSGVGVFGRSASDEAVHGVTLSPGAAAVIGINDFEPYNAPEGSSARGGPGVRGVSRGHDGVSGTSSSRSHAGVAGTNDFGGRGVGVYGRGTPAGRFDGDVSVNGDVIVKEVNVMEYIRRLERIVSILVTKSPVDLHPTIGVSPERFGVVINGGAFMPLGNVRIHTVFNPGDFDSDLSNPVVADIDGAFELHLGTGPAGGTLVVQAFDMYTGQASNAVLVPLAAG